MGDVLKIHVGEAAQAVQTPESTGAPRSGMTTRPIDVASEVVALLQQLGVCAAFGITGGAVARVFDALARASFPVAHCRHEGSAAFAATEASLAAGRPALVYCTTGPGLMNTLTGLAAARAEGAHVILVSAMTAAAVRGRGACQETTLHTVPSGLFEAGPLFHYAEILEHPAQLDTIAARLTAGLAQPGGFVAHIAIPTSVQAAPHVPRPSVQRLVVSGPGSCEAGVQEAVDQLAHGSFAIWAGFGARNASHELRMLAEATGAPVMCSPRAKGVFPESHPLYLGITGLGGHDSVEAFFAREQPASLLVLGTRLQEPTSYWQDSLMPARTMIHVDTDASVFGAAFPAVRTIGIQAEIGIFLRALMGQMAGSARRPPTTRPLGPGRPPGMAARPHGPVRAAVLMAAVQRRIVEGSDALVLTESGNSFAWGNSLLRFDEPGRYRVSVGFGSMGHAAAGVLGPALVRQRKTVAIVGDGSMLMTNEVSTAAAMQVPAVWIVMNDGGYGMVRQGMRAQGFNPPDMSIPHTDFAGMARAMGADGATVDAETELDHALARAMEAQGPFVVDVRTDPHEAGPWSKRIKALILQGTDAKLVAR